MSSERERHRSTKSGWFRGLFSFDHFKRNKSIVTYHLPLKESKKDSHELADHSSAPAAASETDPEIYQETQMVRSVDGKGKLLQSDIFPQNNWMHRSPLNDHGEGQTQTSCYSAV